MPREFGRNQRVAPFIKRELSVLIQREFPVCQYGIITVNHVDVAADLKNADVYITLLADNKAREPLIAILNKHTGRFRYEISRVMTAKYVPSLHFKYDEPAERARRLTDIIDSFAH